MITNTMLYLNTTLNRKQNSFFRIAILAILLFFGYFASIAYASIEPIPEGITSLSALPNLKKNMESHEPARCHALLNDLDVVKVRYYGFDNKVHTGALIVHKELSKDIQAIFQRLLAHQFPIEKIHPIGEHHKEKFSSTPNYTIAYNCRAVTGQKMLSQHSYGRAIDINPMINPYVKNGETIPKEGKPYIDRAKAYKGKITKNSLIVSLFIERGWDWGGNWFDVQDYQHFEKRANGEKRNPYGY